MCSSRWLPHVRPTGWMTPRPGWPLLHLTWENIPWQSLVALGDYHLITGGSRESGPARAVAVGPAAISSRGLALFVLLLIS